MAAPVEAKVKASTAAAALSGLALWALGRYVFKGDVPDVVTSWVYVIVAGGLTLGAGYLARHTVLPGEPPVITIAPKYRLPPEVPASVPPLTSMPPAAAETQAAPPPPPAPDASKGSTS
jgi:hypothetical protein